MVFLSLVAIVLSILAIKKSNEALERVSKIESHNKHTEGHNENHTQNNHHVHQAQTIHLASHDTTVAKVTIPSNDEVSDHNHSEDEDGSVHNKEHQKNSYTTSSQKMEVKPTEPQGPDFIDWLKEDWLLKLGGVLVIMGALFFLSLAYTNVGPAGKIAMGYLFGGILMVFGFWYAKKQLVGGSAIHVIGAIIVIITTYLAREPGYDFFNEYIASLLMFLTTVCIALTAYAYKRASLAHVGLFMAGLVPVFTGTISGDFTSLLIYLGIVIIGVLWLAFVTEWRTLILIALVGFMGYSLLYIGGGMGGDPMTSIQKLLVTIYGIVFFLTSLFSIMRSGGQARKEDGIVALLNAGLALMWIFGVAQKEHISILLALVGLLYAVGVFCVYKVTDVYTSFLLYGGVALGMLATAVVYEVSGRAETVALLLIGAGASVITYHLSRDEKTTQLISLFNIIPLLYVFRSVAAIEWSSYRSVLQEGIWKDFLIVGLAICVYISLYAYFSKRSKSLSYTALFASVMFIVISAWQVIHLFVEGSFGTAIAFFVIGIGLTVFAYYFSDKDEDVTSKTALVNVLTIIYGLRSIGMIDSTISNSSVQMDVWKDWLVVISIIIAAYAFYFYFKGVWKNLSYVSLTTALVFVILAVWQGSHAIIGGGMATFVALLIYTVVGLAFLFQGVQAKQETKIKLSRIWLGLVAAKVIFHDAWRSGDIALGVLICIVIGLLLLSSTFIIKKVTNEQV